MLRSTGLAARRTARRRGRCSRRNQFLRRGLTARRPVAVLIDCL
jgi:hypothetical protein